LSGRYAGTMHEDSQATDVSVFPGPVPGANDTIIRIPIRDRQIVEDEMVYLNLGQQVRAGSLVHTSLKKKATDAQTSRPQAGKARLDSRNG
jgi:hypothetical protein